VAIATCHKDTFVVSQIQNAILSLRQRQILLIFYIVLVFMGNRNLKTSIRINERG
jgi:hypothetical protein